ncbi:MAG: phosphomannomutase, partial [Acidocella sp.]|nr:phosphomannomutase [Acidocella sp.]
GSDIRALGEMAAAGDVVAETQGSERSLAVVEDYLARLVQDWDGGDRALKVVWDNGNGAAGDVLAALVKRLPGQHTV